MNLSGTTLTQDLYLFVDDRTLRMTLIYPLLLFLWHAALLIDRYMEAGIKKRTFFFLGLDVVTRQVVTLKELLFQLVLVLHLLLALFVAVGLPVLLLTQSL
jgi:hypothetical protein